MNLVSEVQISVLRSNDGELVAFAAFTISGVIRCKSVAIVRRLNGGYRLLYPTKKIGGQQINYFFPITVAAGREIERTVVDEYLRILGEQ